MTYYLKCREEKVEDFKKEISKLLVFSEPEDTRKSVEEEIKNISKNDLAEILKFLRNCKTQFSESAKSLTKRLSVEKLTGSFN